MSGGYVSVPNAIMRDQTLTPGTRVLFGVILSYAWESGGGRCIVSKDDLAKQAGISVSTFWASIKVLRERGLVEVVQTRHPRGVVNEYRPVTSPVRISDDPPSDMSDHRTGHVQQSDTEEDEEKKTNTAAALREHAPANDWFKQCVQAGQAKRLPWASNVFQHGEYAQRIEAMFAATEPAVADSVRRDILDAVAAGKVRKDPAEAVRAFIGNEERRREQEPGPHLFPGRPLTRQQSAQQRDEIRFARMRGNA